MLESELLRKIFKDSDNCHLELIFGSTSILLLGSSILLASGEIKPNNWQYSRIENAQTRVSLGQHREAYWYSLFPFLYQELIMSLRQQLKFNPLLTISVIRQESIFDPKIDSRVGALGLI